MTRDGNAIGGGGGSTLGFSFDPDRQLSPYRLVQGSAPTGADDVVMDKATATKHHFAVGDRVLMNLPNRPQTFTITGIVTFGSDDNLAGVTLAGFSLPTAQTAFNARGRFDTISVLAAPGADTVKLQRAIAAILPVGRAGRQRPGRGQRALERRGQRAVVHLDGAVDLRVHRAVRGRVHDLQHVLDHRRAANSGVGAAARRRSEPTAGIRLGAGRGRAHGTHRLRDRTGAGHSRRARPQGAAERVRHRPALLLARRSRRARRS